MGRIFCNLRGGDCESNDGKKGDEAVEHVWQSGGFLDNRGLDALFGEDQWGRSPPPLYCKDALRIVYFFSLKHRCETWACCVNRGRSRITAARSGSNNHPVGSYGWPCEVEDHIDSRYGLARGKEPLRKAVVPLHQWSRKGCASICGL